MGSSSKSRDKDRRRKSKSPEERKSRRDKSKDSKKRTRTNDDSPRNDHERDEQPSPAKSSRRERQAEDEQHVQEEEEHSGSGSGQRNEELSIEETNKLRIKLGLKPLEMDDGSKKDGDDGDKRTGSTEANEIFIKTENLSEKKEADKIRERVQTQREKRKILEKLKSIKPLGHESSDEDDDAVSWVQRSREIERQKALLKERQLQEQDEELEREEKEKETIKKQHLYRDKDLAGLTVGHSLDIIKEGSQVILTLKDKDLLDEKDEDGDVLENVNLKDDEKAAENVINRKLGKRDYNPYDDDEDKNLLSKYDETIDGKKKESFKLGQMSTFDQERIKLKKMQEEAKMNGKILLSLDDDYFVTSKSFASEYYTEEEMKKFKKPKKKIKKSSLRSRIADELIPLESSSKSDPDLASRSKRRRVDEDQESDNKPKDEDNKHEDEEIKDDEKVDFPKTTKVKTPKLNLMEIDEEDKEEDDLSGVVVDDEAEEELQAALEKARKLKEKKEKSSVERIASLISIKRVKDEDEDQKSDPKLHMNSLAEFCRNIGESRTRDEDGDEDSDMNDSDEEEVVIKPKKEKSDKKPLIRSSDPAASSSSKSSSSRAGRWSQVNNEQMEIDEDESDEEERKNKPSLKSTPILGEEPDLTIGVAAALKMAKNKGYLESDSKKSGAVKSSSSISAVNYQIDEKFNDTRGRGGSRGDRYSSGPISEFKEKSNYKPDVNLEYIDDEGRKLNEKEAFRVLSHKFHGKGPGKNKIDKRLKKLNQESKLRQMSSIDTPLNTVKMLQEKQKELQSPYVVISGQSTSLVKK